jgi:hypothetical protein
MNIPDLILKAGNGPIRTAPHFAVLTGSGTVHQPAVDIVALNLICFYNRFHSLGLSPIAF